MYNRSTYLKVFGKPPHIHNINDAIKRQTIFNQLNIMVSYVDIIVLCYTVAILRDIYVMWPKCQVKWLCFHFKRMLITRLGQ